MLDPLKDRIIRRASQPFCDHAYRIFPIDMNEHIAKVENQGFNPFRLHFHSHVSGSGILDLVFAGNLAILN
jgi:hypothetical protein